MKQHRYIIQDFQYELPPIIVEADPCVPFGQITEIIAVSRVVDIYGVKTWMIGDWDALSESLRAELLNEAIMLDGIERLAEDVSEDERERQAKIEAETEKLRTAIASTTDPIDFLIRKLAELKVETDTNYECIVQIDEEIHQ